MITWGHATDSSTPDHYQSMRLEDYFSFTSAESSRSSMSLRRWKAIVRDKGSSCSTGISPSSSHWRSRTFSWLWVTCSQTKRNLKPRTKDIFKKSLVWDWFKKAHFLNMGHYGSLCLDIQQFYLLDDFFFTFTLLRKRDERGKKKEGETLRRKMSLCL